MPFTAYVPAEPRAQGQVGLETAGYETGQAMKVEAAPFAREPFDALVPVAAREVGELITQMTAVQRRKRGMAAFTEDAEEVVELQGANAGDFQLEQRGLARIRVDGVDALWRQQRVIEDVAAGARNDEQNIFRGEVERLSIDRGIFPAGVVDEGAGVKSPKQTLIEPIGECRCFLQRSVCHGHEFMNGTERR